MNKAYEKVWTRDISMIAIKAHMYRHIASGAEIIYLENDDTNKAFAIGFQTISQDETGVPHILEHSVLAESKKYPLKDPFAALLKSSLNTYLNAFTYPDRTIYPVASKNDEDLKNLIDVYLNAVFNPLLTENTFKQEGWHYELDDSNKLTYKGVVYNEMKGVYSNVDSLVEDHIFKAVFPDTHYAKDSGGSPESIPTLTLENFREFYKKFYHASNAKVYLYGKLDIEAYLNHIEPYLSQFEKKPSTNQAQLQPYLKSPRSIEHMIPVAPEKKEKGAVLTMGWLLGSPEEPVGTPKKRVAWGVITSLLMESDASPFKKAILESKLGESMNGVGYEEDLYQPFFYMGLKNVKTTDFAKIEKLFLKELKKFVEAGINKELLSSIITKLEFEMREMEPQSHSPKPILLFTTLMRSWIYGRDPLESLDVEKIIQELKEHITDGSNYFENLIQSSLIDNTHRVTLRSIPDPEAQEKFLTHENQVLTEKLNSLDEEEKTQLKKETLEFHKYQQQEDSPEALATLPKLKVSDLDRNNEIVSMKVIENSPYTVLYNPITTNGIVYLDYQFDISHLSFEQKSKISLLSEYLLRLPTNKHTAEEIAIKIDSSTGDLSTGFIIRPHLDTNENVMRFSLTTKFLAEKVDEVLNLIKEVITELSFEDTDRIKRILSEEKSANEDQIVSRGHAFAFNYSKAAIHPLFAQSQYFSGLKYIQNLKKWDKEFESKQTEFINDLESLYKNIFVTENLVIHITADPELVKTLSNKIIQPIESLPNSFTIKGVKSSSPDFKQSSAFIVPAQVSYQGMSLPIKFTPNITKGSLLVIQELVNIDYLWKKVRQLGGAYGSGILFDLGAQVASFYSYRDPNISKTYEIFNDLGNFLIEASKTISQREIDDCIIAAIASMDPPLNSQEKGYDTLVRYLVGYSNEKRQKVRDELLSTNPENIKAFGEYLLTVKPEEIAIASLAGKELLERKENKGLFEVTESL